VVSDVIIMLVLLRPRSGRGKHQSVGKVIMKLSPEIDVIAHLACTRSGELDILQKGDHCWLVKATRV
jgi:hypothetical protein